MCSPRLSDWYKHHSLADRDGKVNDGRPRRRSLQIQVEVKVEKAFLNLSLNLLH